LGLRQFVLIACSGVSSIFPTHRITEGTGTAVRGGTREGETEASPTGTYYRFAKDTVAAPPISNYATGNHYIKI